MTNGLDPVLNFEVTPSWDKRVLVVTDISDWKHLIDEPSYIEITLPGSKTAVRHSYSKNKVMVFNASTLNYGCSSGCEDELPPLPDGIYKIKIYVCEGTQFSYERQYLRTVSLEVRLQREIMALDIGCMPNSGCLNKIIEAEFMIKGAKADIFFGNITSAQRKYQLAVDIVEHVEHCDCSKDCGNGHTTTAY